MIHNTPITDLKGIGDKTAGYFNKLNITYVKDLLYHFPRDYETFEEPINIKDTVPGEICAVYASVTGIPNLKKVRNLTILNVLIKDSTGGMQLTFFNMPYLKKVLKQGGHYVFRGMIQTRGAAKIMEQPKLYSMEDYRKQTNMLQPRYSLTKGLSNQSIQKAVKQALTFYTFEKEYYPSTIIDEYKLISGKEALCSIHFPIDKEELQKARKRIVFDEFFSFLLMLRKNKELSAKLENQFQMFETADTVRFLEQLPFNLTKGQKHVWQEIRNDLASPYCMNRLIQGDVGSGKTIIALLALLMCVANGHQGAMMAPTEVLAKQHFESIKTYTKQYGLAFKPILLAYLESSNIASI